MKKLLILTSAVVLIAAGCNSTATTPNQLGNLPAENKQATSSVKVEAAVNALNNDVDNEDAAMMHSDEDLVSGDTSVINGFNGVSDASY